MGESLNAGQAKPDLELVRVSVAPEGSFGVLLIDGVPAGPVTVERTYPVADSEPRGPQFVKIPPGHYRCERTQFNRGGYTTFEVKDVVGHSRLLFHKGNSEGDSEGCILVGQRFGFLKGRPAVLESQQGFWTFMALMGGKQSFQLEVRNH